MISKIILLLSLLGSTFAWPGMKHKKVEGADYIGPACTVGKIMIMNVLFPFRNLFPFFSGAHNWHPESGDCPNMEQPPAPAPSSNNTHIWPNNFIVDWKFYFVPDDNDVPPYLPLPTTPYNVTTGRTYYHNDPVTGERNMKEVYDEYCIPVFGNPISPMGHGNKYSCDFLNVMSFFQCILSCLMLGI